MSIRVGIQPDGNGDAPTCLVVGGGPTGIATALAAQDHGLHVVVVERSDYSDIRLGEHLSARSKPLFQALGLFEMLESAEIAVPCPVMRSAWGYSELFEEDSIFNPYGDDLLLSRPAFDAALAREAIDRGVELHTETRVRGLERIGNAWRYGLETKDGCIDRGADFVVDATGRRAHIARACGGRLCPNDRLLGIVAYVPAMPDVRKDHHVLLESASDGWWYSASLPNDHDVVVYMTDADLVASFGQRPAECMRNGLGKTTHTRDRIGRMDRVRDVHVRSARTQRLDTFVGEGWLAVGDAAMAFDPLSSQGIHKGIAHAMEGAVAIAKHLSGGASALNVYASAREEEYRNYLEARAFYYAQEQRWAESVFWNRRRNDRIRDAI